MVGGVSHGGKRHDGPPVPVGGYNLRRFLYPFRPGHGRPAEFHHNHAE
jgi:hypothetical protein